MLTSLPALLRHRASEGPRPIYHFLDEARVASTAGFAEVDAAASRVAARLQADHARGERVLLLVSHGLAFLAGFFGAQYAGLIPVPVPELDPARLHRTLPRVAAIAADATPAVIFTTREHAARQAELTALAPALGQPAWLAFEDLPPAAFPHPVDEAEAIALLQYTSGSTAAPKGVVVRQKHVLRAMEYNTASYGFDATTVLLTWMPPYHELGLMDGVVQPLWLGVPIFQMRAAQFIQQPIRWVQALSAYRATYTAGPNFAYELAVRRVPEAERARLDLSALRCALNGAEPVRHDTLERFLAAYASQGLRRSALLPGYGMSEATLKIATWPPTTAGWQTLWLDPTALAAHRVVPVAPDAPGARPLVAQGHPLPEFGNHALIVHPETGVVAAPDEVGEVWLASPSTADGYWQKPAETIRTFQARPIQPIGNTAVFPDGPYLRTGDLGFFHDGELYLTGRVKDLIIVRGQNHYPQDLELTAERCHPRVRPGCITAFSVDHEGEERLVVAAEVGPPQGPDDGPEAVVAAVRRAISQAHDLFVWQVLLLAPGQTLKTSSGKLARHAARSAFLASSFALVTA